MLARAVNLQFRLAGSGVVDALRKEALDRVPQGMLALDVHGRILLMNGSAQSAVADKTAFRVRNGRLQCADTAVQARLEVCIKDALRRRGSQGGVLLAGRGLTRYSLMVTPARTESRDESAAFVPVFIARLGADHTDASIAQFPALFSLTLSEARIAAGLVRGRALKDIAMQLRMTYESARFLVKQIFVKVGVHTQAGLVALLSEALHRPPATRAEAEPDGDV